MADDFFNFGAVGMCIPPDKIWHKGFLRKKKVGYKPRLVPC